MVKDSISAMFWLSVLSQISVEGWRWLCIFRQIIPDTWNILSWPRYMAHTLMTQIHGTYSHDPDTWNILSWPRYVEHTLMTQIRGTYSQNPVTCFPEFFRCICVCECTGGCECSWVWLQMHGKWFGWDVAVPLFWVPCPHFRLSQYMILQVFVTVCVCLWVYLSVTAGVQEVIDVILGGTLGCTLCISLVTCVSVWGGLWLSVSVPGC